MRFTVALFVTVAACAQQPQAPPSIPSSLRGIYQLVNDYGNLNRYAADNQKVQPPAAGEERVVFMGDSITDGWGRSNNPTVMSPFFPGKPYINRGISGQTTPQMLIRFRPDVIALKPKVVVILAGTNDIAGNTGPSTLEMIQDNMASMVDLAQKNGIKVVLSSVMPVCDYIQNQTRRRPNEQIVALNKWIKEYAAGAVDPRPLVAATVGLDEAGSVLAGWRPADAGAGPKIHIDPRKP